MNDILILHDDTANNKSMNITEYMQLDKDLFMQWATYIDAKPRTIETYRKSVQQFFMYMQQQHISRPTRDDVIAYRDALKQNHKPTTVQTYMAAVKLFFQWTAQNGYYPNVADHVKGAKLDNAHKKDSLTSKQAGKLLNAIDRSTLQGKRDYAIISLMITTGLRTISVSLANIEDIRNVGDETALFYQGKGHEEKADYVKLAPPVEDAIREYLRFRTDEATNKAPLFSSVAHRNSGGRMTTRSISRLAKEHMIDIGLNSDRLTAHSLRHTAATLNLLNGATIEETRQLLAHSNINTTLIYSHALERSKNNSEKRIATAIFG